MNSQTYQKCQACNGTGCKPDGSIPAQSIVLAGVEISTPMSDHPCQACDGIGMVLDTGVRYQSDDAVEGQAK